MVDYTTRIGLALGIKGLMNVQMLIMKENGRSTVYVFEVNPRASRTVPFISKVTGVPMVRVATKIMAGVSWIRPAKKIVNEAGRYGNG